MMMRPTFAKFSSRSEMFSEKAGKFVVEFSAYEVNESMRPNSIGYRGPPACDPAEHTSTRCSEFDSQTLIYIESSNIKEYARSCRC